MSGSTRTRSSSASPTCRASAQATELDLSAWKDRIPLEMLGRTHFPAIGELPYMITLAPYGFYWFQLQERDKSERVDAARGAGIRNAGGAARRRPGCRWRAPAACSSATCCPDFLARTRWYPERSPKAIQPDADLGDPVLRHRRQPALGRVLRSDPARRDPALRAADADRVGALRSRALQPACLRRRAPGRARGNAARRRDRPRSSSRCCCATCART